MTMYLESFVLDLLPIVIILKLMLSVLDKTGPCGGGGLGGIFN